MKFVKFSPSILTPPQMVQQSSDTESAITTYSLLFPSLPFTAAQLGTQRGIVSTKKTALENALLLVAQTAKDLGIESDKLGSMLLQTAGGVDVVAQGDPTHGKEIANKGGFASVHDAVAHTAVPDAPTGFSVSIGDHSGNADLHWDKMKFTQLYKTYYSLNTVTPTWVLADSTDKSSITLHGLPTGAPILFKVEGHNPNGDGAPSAVVTKTLV